MTYVETGRKELKTDWPVTEGLTGKTEKQTGRNTQLTPEDSVVPKRLKVGIG